MEITKEEAAVIVLAMHAANDCAIYVDPKVAEIQDRLYEKIRREYPTFEGVELS